MLLDVQLNYMPVVTNEMNLDKSFQGSMQR